MNRSPVVAVCGIPGSGKTTLCTAIQRATGAALVTYDRYERITQTPPDELAAWLATGADFADIHAPGLTEAIEVASQRGPVILDSPLGRALPECEPLISHQIWLDCPSDLALSRKLRQFLDSGHGEERYAWVSNYLSVYPTTVRPLFLLQQKRVQKLSDTVINSNRSLDTVSSEALLIMQPHLQNNNNNK